MTETFFQQVEWVGRLPNEGGEWGKGIVNTVRERQSVMDGLQSDIERLDAEKHEKVLQIAQQKKLLRATVKRAESECTMLFADAQIAEAKEPELEDALP